MFTCHSKKISDANFVYKETYPYRNINYKKKRVKVIIARANVDRELFISDVLSSVSGKNYYYLNRENIPGSDGQTNIWEQNFYMEGCRNISAKIIIGKNEIKTYQRSLVIPKNNECSIEIIYETLADTSGDSDLFTFFSVVKSNAGKTIKQV